MKADDLSPKRPLNERVMNLFTADEKQRYAHTVWDMLVRSYASIGGFKSAATVEELIDDSGLWKVITSASKPVAVSVYKDKHGRKRIASGTDGSPEGKKAFIQTTKEDIRMERAWAEVSGAPEAIMNKMGARPLPNKYAAALTGKEILSLNADGFHYTRLIAGHSYEKIIYGAVNLTSDQLEAMSRAGVKIHPLG